MNAAFIYIEFLMNLELIFVGNINRARRSREEQDTMWFNQIWKYFMF